MTTSDSWMVLESCALVAPVTALEFLGDDYLLTGEGPILSVFSVEGSPQLCASQNVLHYYRIHGIRPKPQTIHDAKPNSDCPALEKVTELVIFGGKGLRLINISPCGRGLESAGPLMELQDWLLDVSWLMAERCPLLGVSLAHNATLLLEPQSGKVLSLCSCAETCLLYSAILIGQSWETSVLVGGTVFNQLVLWRPGTAGRDTRCQVGTQVERRLLGHSGVIFSLCYLQSSGWLASASDDRSVRVWNVGELGGRGGCGEESPTCLRVLYGHQARVFCTRLSPGRVFSGGEDGTCLLWDWEGEGRVGRTLKSHRSGGIRALAVSNGSVGEGCQWVATGGADGGVRLWKVLDHSTKNEQNELEDLGFEGLGCPKVVRSVGGHNIFTCSDQGQVCLHQDGLWKEVWHGGPDFQSYCVMEVACIQLQDFSTGKGVWVCAVGNLNGGVQVFPLCQPGGGTFLQASVGKIHSLQWVERKSAWGRDRRSWCLLASGSEGLVHRWAVDVAKNEQTNPYLVLHKLKPFLLPPCAKRWLTAAVTVTLPSGKRVLWVCGDRRGSLLLYREEHEDNRLEDKEESNQEDTQERVVDPIASIPPVATLFGVHGKQGVTSICERHGVCYSSGRDGCVRVLALNKDSLNVRRIHRACKGMDWLEKVLFLDSKEGKTWKDATVDDQSEEKEEEEEDRTSERALTNGFDGEQEEERDGRNPGKGTLSEAKFLMAGFHSVQFVLWDPLKQEKVFSVNCGGGHRSWIYIPFSAAQTDCSHQTLEQGTLVFIKQGAIMVSRSFASSATEVRGHTLREGLHGRALACVCHLGAVSKPVVLSETWEVLVTGGEDTTVTVLAVRPEHGTVKVLAVIADHISNVRTLTAVPRGAKEDGTSRWCKEVSSAFSTLVFSAGGRAQLQCYHLLIGWDEQCSWPTCQVTQIAGHRLDEQWERRRNRHKTVKMDPETRYMSMAVLHDGTEEVFLALACSDGAVRIFSVGEDSRKAELLWESFYHQRCVLSVASYSLVDVHGKWHVLLLSGATDGAVALWDLTAVLDSKSRDSWHGPSAPCFSVPVHQSGVNALVISNYHGHHQIADDVITVASGGDDGLLSIMKIKVEINQSDKTEKVCAQLLSHWSIPIAHSAPLTALSALSSARWVSTSPDQRVCVWRLGDDGLHHQGTIFTHTADAAGLWTWHREGGAFAVVCGQGLQLFKLLEEEEGKATDTLRPKEREKQKVVFAEC